MNRTFVSHGVAVWRLSLLVLFSITFTKAAKAAPAVATVLGLRGAGQVRHGGKSAGLAQNASLYVGDVVRVGAGAKVTLLFKDGSQTRLNSGATVQITAPTPIAGGKRSLFRVVSGEIWARMRPNKGVQTASAVLGVAGTEFDIVVSDTQTTLTVIEGVVDFSNPYGAVAVKASQQSSATPTTAPTIPVTVAGAGFIVEWTFALNNAVIPREKFFVSLDKAKVKQELAAGTTDDLRTGELQFDLGDYSAALASFEKAQQGEASSGVIFIRLGYALLELDRPDRAFTAFEGALLALDSDSATRVEARIGISNVKLSQADFAGAEKSSLLALSIEPDSAEAAIALGLAQSRQMGREGDAATTFQNVIDAAQDEHSYQAQSWLALLQISANDPAGAQKNATAAVQKEPLSGLAHGNLALVYFYAGQPSPAVKEARIATRLNPKSIAATVALGQALLASGDVDGATRAATQAVALDPGLSAGHYLLGIADAQRRDYVHAERSLKESLRLTPEFLPSASALARVYNRTGRPKDALALLTMIQGAQSENDGVAAALGEVLYEQGRYRDALAQYERAVKLNPVSALNRAGLARVAIDANHLNEAISSGQKAVQLAPEVGQYHSILGLAYTYSRLDVQAEREYRSALAVDPRNSLALVQLAFLNQDGDTRTTSRTAGLAFAQGFLYDPAISRELLRGGVDNEATARGGSKSNGATYTLRDIGDDGKFHFYGQANRIADEGNRTNSFARELNARQDSTYTLGRTDFYFHSFYRSDENGLSGTSTNPATDDRAKFDFQQGILASRTRIGARGQLYTGLFANSQKENRTNPNRDTSFILPGVSLLNTPIDIANSDQHSNATDPELRFDWRLNDDPALPSIFSLGAARLSTSGRFDRSLFLPGLFGGPDSTGILHTDNRTRTNLLFAQLTQRTSAKLNYSLQLRAQRSHNDGSFTFQNLSGNALNFVAFSNAIASSKTLLLPAINFNYQLDRHTALRLFASRRATDVTSSILTPAEAQLSSEGQILPFGLASRANVGEFDIERQMPGNGLFKVFGFRSSAHNLLIDASGYLNSSVQSGVLSGSGILLNRVQRTGVGARYEKQLSRSFFGQAGLVLNRTKSDRPGGGAPYQPAYLATTGLSYIDSHGDKATVTLNYAGSYSAFPANPGASIRIPGKATVDFRLAREPTVRTELFLQVTNLFDTRQFAFRDVPLAGRRVEVGLSKRF